MTFLPGRLGTLLAKDLMSTTILILKDGMTVDDAKEQLRAKRHSGAPVIDKEGKLVGTFSVRDIIQTKAPAPTQQELRNELAAGSGSWLLADQIDATSDEEPVQYVGNRMRKNISYVEEREPLIIVARRMCDHHMHRVPVVNHEMKLVGIISTMDILAALVHTADESEIR